MSSVKTFLAFILTLLLVALAPRFSKDSANAEYYSDRSAGFVIDHSSLANYSQAGNPEIEVWLLAPADTIPFQLNLFYRKVGSDSAMVVPMQLSTETVDRYKAEIPRLGRKEEYQYHIEMMTADSSVTLRLPKDVNSEIDLIFEGRPSLILWAAHVVVMFLAAMSGFLALFRIFGLSWNERNIGKLSRRVFATGILLLLGTALVGSLVSYSRFGYYWGGWPFADNMAQTYLEILILYWLGLTVIFRGTIFGFHPHKNLVSNTGAIILTLIGVLFMIVVYLAGGHFVDIPL